MRFLTADYLFPLYKNPIKNGVLQISESGEILNVFDSEAHVPKEKIERFSGVLCPGFVNAHAHLELSHLLALANKGKGFLDFLSVVNQRDSFGKEYIQKSIEDAEHEMIDNGIVAVGDIVNTTDTLMQKKKKNLLYYNFIEVFEIDEKKITTTFYKATDLRKRFRLLNQKSTIVPHAAYSVPPKLMQLIAESFDDGDELFTIHSKETKEEENLFRKKTGGFYEWLNSIGASSSIWLDRHKSIDILGELYDKKTLLVHNIFTKKEEVTTNYYCTCPKSNLYIENQLPDYSIFDLNKLCVGTDSLASNNSLSILEELLVIQENTKLDLNSLLKIGSKNGAKALGFDHLGTFEQGKKPGVVLIKEIDEMKIFGGKVERII